MYISIKKNDTANNGTIYYFYYCESKRIDGKVKNLQKYLFKLPQSLLSHADKLIDSYCIFLSWCDSETTEKVKIKAKEKVFDLIIDLQEELTGVRLTAEQRQQIKDNKNKCNGKNYNYNTNNYDMDLAKELFKAGYKQLSKKYHPDICVDSENKMQEVNRVYENLKTKFNM